MFNLIRFPDGISLLNGLFGLSSILILIFDFSPISTIKFHVAFSLILLGLLADGLDGILARKYGKGELGDFFEAMSDMTTMGVAPSVFIAILVNSHSQNNSLFLIVGFLLLFYIGCAFIRLASFHPLKNKSVFLGLPASAATMLLLSISFLTQTNNIILSVLFLSSLLMILPVGFPKPNKIMNAITTFIIVLTIVFGLILPFIYFVLFISVLIYIFGGQIYLYFIRKQGSSNA